LRRVTDADLDVVVAISTDPRTNEYRPGGAPTIEESNAIVRDSSTTGSDTGSATGSLNIKAESSA
jgi:hypothetical protein